MKKVTMTFVMLLATFSFVATAAVEKSIGTTVGDFSDMVKDSLKPQLEQRGYKIKLVEFTDYVQPNIALSEGSLDVNIFQHKPYLDQFAKEKGLDLVPVGQVPTAPLAIYAGKSQALAQVKSGSTVAMPNDPTNLARALLMLADLKWIELPAKIDPFKISPMNITKNLKNIKIVQLEAAQIPRARMDVDYAIINGNYVVSSGMALTSALFMEKSEAYVNWAVMRRKDADTDFGKAVKEALNSNEFKTYAKNKFKGYKYPSSWK
jgi:D-methionine transport system substrate-binding protein